MATPNIRNNTWYRVVSTFDGATYKIYINDSLVATNPVNFPQPLDSSVYGILIGCLDTAGGYPYLFNGFIDDMKIYNRALADSEVVQYGASTLSIADGAKTPSFRLYPNPAGNTLFIDGDIANSSYQILNAVGQVIAEGALRGMGQGIPVAGMVPAVYQLLISNGQGRTALKFVKE